MMGDPISFAAAFREIAAPVGPSPNAVFAAFDAILSGAWTPAQVAGFVVALRIKGESPAIIAEAARAMRSAMVPVEHGLRSVLDTCGTGGDGLCTLNISTAAAIVAAAAGVPVAKHGNRAVSSRAGSAEVLEALGVPIDLPANRQAAVLEQAGICFLFAPTHHPAMRHAAVARRELGIRTIFNILGPLANPARATHQLLGTYDDALRPVMAETLRSLGIRRAWVVRGEDGMDEVSPSGPTRVTEVDDGSISERVVGPEDFGLTRQPSEAASGTNAAGNARAIESILRGEPNICRQAVVLNAAAAIAVARGGDLKDAAADADRAVSTGQAMAKLDLWKSVAQRVREES
jgi:anthranilate phosphoribosyltransferase